MQPSVEYQKAVSHLMEETRSFLNDLDLIPRQTPYADSTLLALLSKSIALTEAIVVLVSSGHHEEAFGLCRTNIEIQLTVRYLTNAETAQRNSRFIRYLAKVDNEWMKLVHKYYPNAEARTQTNASELEKLAEQYPDPNKWSQQSHGLKYFAKEHDSFVVREDGSPLTEEFYYEVLYKGMSYYVHAIAPGIEHHFIEPGARFRVYREKGASGLGGHVLRTSFLSVHLNILRILRYLNMDYPEELKAQYEKVVQSYK